MVRQCLIDMDIFYGKGIFIFIYRRYGGKISTYKKDIKKE